MKDATGTQQIVPFVLVLGSPLVLHPVHVGLGGESGGASPRRVL